uniref:Uncharacterized protein n=1 Tax=Ictidomys tridecemlineatus TaxID=43179 RepID=A0A287CX04_ICTTR
SRRSPRRRSRGPGRGRSGSSSRSRSRHSTWGSASTGPQRPGTPARCPALPSSPGAAARAESNPRAGEAPSPCSGLGCGGGVPLPTGKRRPQRYRAATELPDQREDTLWRQRSEKSVNRRSRKITDPFAAGDL